MMSKTESGIWRVASYARLSKEDGEGKFSNSIEAQCKMIADWAAKKKDVELVASYIDDGFSGASFNRPGFLNMMHDAQNGLFDTIVVKDLSRFGRSYLDCGNLIERELPKMGIRLYSISDGFDSMDSWDFNTALLLPVKNLINEMLVIQTSEKVRASLASKRARGEYVANFAPYGYRKDAEDKHKLVVDEQAASVVRQIFANFLAGCTAASIARELNSKEVLSPAAYKQAVQSNYRTCFLAQDMNSKWHAASVLRILRNEIYTGTLVQGKTRLTNCRTGIRQCIPAQDWQRCTDTHEAIVSRDDYYRVSILLAKKI